MSAQHPAPAEHHDDPFSPLPCPHAQAAPCPGDGEAMTSLWVVAGLAMGPAMAQGFGRFAYALILPSMRDDLGWSWADAGAMGTANAIGYLGGELVASTVAARFGAKRAFVVALVVTAVTIASTAAFAGYWSQGALRIVTGLASGIAFVVGGALATAAGAGGGAARAPTAIGVYVAGVGFGVALSALAVPPVVAHAGWRGGWLTLGALALLSVFAALPATRLTPAPRARPPGASSPPFSLKPMRFELVAYGLVGAGYIAYATFVIAYLQKELGFSKIETSAFWAILGVSVIAFTFVWGPVLARLRGGLGMIATSLVMTSGVVLVLLDASRPAAFISAALFGAAGLATVTAVTTFARRVYPPESWTTAIGALTVAFGLGQIVGPVLSGAVSDGPTGLAAGLWLSIAILVAAIVVAALQRERG